MIDTARFIYPSRNDIFTWSQGCNASRIDKIIVQDSFIVKQFIHDVNSLSDHVVIVTHLQLDQIQERGFGRWKNNILLYDNEFFKTEFGILWENWKETSSTSCPLRFWVDAKKKIRKFLIDIGKITASEKRLQKSKKYDDLMSIYKNGKPNASDITQYLEGKKALAKMEIDYIKEKMDLNKSREFLEGDRPTKCFFSKTSQT